MTNLDKLLKHGTYDEHDGEISSEGDFIIKFTTIRHKTPTARHEYDEYIANIKITYNDTILVKDIIDFERFMASLKIFTDKRNLFKEKDIYFEEKVKYGTSSLQLVIDKERYINLVEATQMSMLILGILRGYSRDLLYLKKFKKCSGDYVSAKMLHRKDHLNLTNPQIIDWKYS